MKLIKEFKKFAVKGNMIDMAVGIIIGAAFNNIIKSLVKDLIMPPLGYVIGKVNFENLKVVLQHEHKNDAGKVLSELITLNIGSFIQVVFDFTIIAFSIFIAVKVFNMLRSKAEDPDNKAVDTPKDIELLAEIRDLLKGVRPR
jgi:large conductance mechanosensitive channel